MAWSDEAEIRQPRRKRRFCSSWAIIEELPPEPKAWIIPAPCAACGGLLDGGEVEGLVHLEERVLRLGDDVLGDGGGGGALGGVGAEVAQADVGAARQLELEVGVALEAEAAAEAGDGRGRDLGALGELDDRGVDGEVGVVEDEAGEALLQRGQAVVLVGQGGEDVHAGLGRPARARKSFSLRLTYRHRMRDHSTGKSRSVEKIFRSPMRDPEANPFPPTTGAAGDLGDAGAARHRRLPAADWRAGRRRFRRGELHRTRRALPARRRTRGGSSFPTLAAYRDEWLRQAREAKTAREAGLYAEDARAAIFRATRLEEIEIDGRGGAGRASGSTAASGGPTAASTG